MELMNWFDCNSDWFLVILLVIDLGCLKFPGCEYLNYWVVIVYDSMILSDSIIWLCSELLWSIIVVMSIDFVVEIPKQIDAMWRWKNMSWTVSDEKSLEFFESKTELKTKPLNPSPLFLWSRIKNLALTLDHSFWFTRIVRGLV